jgi:hypothetical protein
LELFYFITGKPILVFLLASFLFLFCLIIWDWREETKALRFMTSAFGRMRCDMSALVKLNNGHAKTLNDIHTKLFKGKAAP